jgi:type II pantothenate kinase
MRIISYDCGLTRTKCVTFENGKTLSKSIVIGLPEINKNDGLTVATGVLAEKTGADIIIPEFEAAAAGLRALSGESDFTGVVIGTGTPFLRVNENAYAHIGGTGVGGGTVSGLGGLLCGETDFDKLYALSKSGDRTKLDLMLRDISEETSRLLPDNVTACNFGKCKTEAAAADKAAAVFNLVFETVFVMAVLAAKDTDKIVVGGGLSMLPEAVSVAKQVGAMHGKTFIFPEDRDFSNAIGAAIAASKKQER